MGTEYFVCHSRQSIERIRRENAKEIEALESRIAKLEGKKDTYPCIKRDPRTNCVVEFESINSGVCLNQGVSPGRKYSYCNWWGEDHFTEILTEYTIKV